MRWPGECCPGLHSSYTGGPSGVIRDIRAPSAASPLPQACNRFVISTERASMNSPFSRGYKKYTRLWPLLPFASACSSGKENRRSGISSLIEAIYERKGDDYETQHRKDC